MKSMVEVGSKYQPKIRFEGTKRAVRVAKILRPWRNCKGF